jgi:hypothetical protein
MYQKAPLVLCSPERLIVGRFGLGRKGITMATWSWLDMSAGLSESDERVAGPADLPAPDRQNAASLASRRYGMNLAAPELAAAERPPVAAAAGNAATGGQDYIERAGAGDLAARRGRATTLAGARPLVWCQGPTGCEDTEAPRS